MKKISFYTVLNYCVLGLIGIVCFYPFWYVLMYSLSTYKEVIHARALILPVGFTLENYKYVLENERMYRGCLNSILVTVTGTALSTLVTVMLAYPLTRPLRGSKWISFMIYFTILFGGGMIPTYLVVRDTGLINSLWSLIIPQLVNPFNFFILRNSMRGLSESLIESATLDGATPVRILFAIVIPLSLPIIATIALFYGARYWNAFFDAVIYISDTSKWTIQLVIRDIILQQNPEVAGGGSVLSEASSTARTLETVKMALIIFSVVPMVAVYPFMQKYFVKGVMVGAVKS